MSRYNASNYKSCVPAATEGPGSPHCLASLLGLLGNADVPGRWCWLSGRDLVCRRVRHADVLTLLYSSISLSETECLGSPCFPEIQRTSQRARASWHVLAASPGAVDWKAVSPSWREVKVTVPDKVRTCPLGCSKTLPSALKCKDDSWNPILGGLEAWARNTGFSSFITVSFSLFVFFFLK